MARVRWNVKLLLLFCGLFAAVFSRENVIKLNEDNWTKMLENEWMVEFYAPWCPACKGLESTWKEFATWSKDLGIEVAKVDVTTAPGLSGRFMVTALPTIFHVINGEFRQYKGTRDKESFITFIEEKKWMNVEPVPSWKYPNSIQMSVVSAFFKLSQILRQIHTQLMEDFGLPTWGSYLIFAVATIILGAVLGLVLVCIIDCIYPPKYQQRRKDRPPGIIKQSSDEEDDELADEDIKDDLLDDAHQAYNNDKKNSDAEEEEDDDEEEEEEQHKNNQQKARSNPSSPNIKKRKARKAD